MLDKLIHSHLNEIDDLEKELDDDIDEVLSHIDIDILVTSPENYMAEVGDVIKQMLEHKYLERSILLGKSLAERVDKKDKVIVDDSTNPRKNEGLSGDKSRS